MTNSAISGQHYQAQFQRQLAQDRLGLRLTARLSDATDSLPHDISERLRAARFQALAKRKVSTTVTATAVNLSGGAATMSFGEENFSLWNKIASAIPVLALLVGLVVITMVQNDNRAREVADVDAALLLDDLPPSAYADPGFVQFLKATPVQSQ